MFSKRIAGVVLAVFCLFALAGNAFAAEVSCDSVYCFTAQDFSSQEEPLMGICITQLPDSHTGAVMLGTRVLQPGDILTSEQVAQMTFAPVRTQEDTQAQVCYLPVYENRVEQEHTMSIAVFGKEDKAPVAQDGTLETYKNLPNEGKLNAADPEQEALVYTLVRSPRRGTVELKEDGSFTYTPKKNKVGVDSFTFTAADPAGNVSREATVTIQILKPAQAAQYTDTVGQDCRFEAEWLRNTGLFEGEKLNEQDCFFPEKSVSKGQFLTMLVSLLDIPTEQTGVTELDPDAPQWLKPYLTAAMRSGLTDGLPQSETGSFAVEESITGAEAAVMLQNALDLTVSQQTLELEQAPDAPAWAASSLTVLAQYGVQLDGEAQLTRSDAAKVLYQVSGLAINAPGTAVFKADQ